MERGDGWPKDPKNQEVLRSLVHIADKENRVAIGGPELIDKLPSHEILPVGFVADFAVQGNSFPVHDGLAVFTSARR